MNSEWKRCLLGELIDITHGFAFKGEYFSDEPPGDILLTPGNFGIGGGFKGDKFKYYNGPVPEDYVLASGDLIVTMTDLSKAGDTLGYSAIVPEPPSGSRFLHNQRLGKVEVLSGSPVDKVFLNYLLQTSQYRHEVLASATGTSVRHTSPGRIKAFEFVLPPINEQRTIAHILGTLDDKIELNRRMNTTLEATARAIFQSWFVDFDPVHAKARGEQPSGMDAETAALFPAAFEESELGLIPAGWRVEPIGGYVQAEKGLSYKGDGLADSGVPMHNLNSVYEGGGYKYEGIKYYTGEYQERHILQAGDVIVTNTEQGFDLLLIGYPAIVPRIYGKTGLFSHHLYRVRPKQDSPLTSCFIFYLFLSPRFHESIAGYSNGTTVNMLPRDALEVPLFIVPPPALIRIFDEVVRPIWDKIELNHQETETLAELRDTLLPRLISGELHVGGIKI